jgi:hypothetical protein
MATRNPAANPTMKTTMNTRAALLIDMKTLTSAAPRFAHDKAILTRIPLPCHDGGRIG